MKKNDWILIASVAAYSYLFYQQNLGINFLVFTISLIVLLFRGGSLFSLNRFIYASPYFILCFFCFLKTENFKIRSVYLLFFGFSLYWLLFGSYVHIQTFGKYELLALFILLPFLLIVSNNKVKAVSYYSFISVNILLQIYFMYRFLNYSWVG